MASWAVTPRDEGSQLVVVTCRNADKPVGDPGATVSAAAIVDVGQPPWSAENVKNAGALVGVAGALLALYLQKSGSDAKSQRSEGTDDAENESGAMTASGRPKNQDQATSPAREDSVDAGNASGATENDHEDA